MNHPDLPKGFHCDDCNHFNPFSSWVFAHWYIEIRGICSKCGTVHILKEGEARKEQTK